MAVILALHNLMRWVVVIMGVVVLARAYVGWTGKHAWARFDRTAGMIFTSALDVQFLLGIILVVLVGFSKLGVLAYEHVIPMIVAVMLAHIGGQFSKKASSDIAKHRAAALWYSLAMVVILMAIPWWRPLLPGM